MNTFRALVATTVTSILLAAGAGAAHAYPDGILSIDVDGSVCSDDTVPVTLDAGVDAEFVLTFNGQTKSGSEGSTFTTSVKAPSVTSTKTIKLSAQATYLDDASVEQTLEASTNITVRDCSDDDVAADDAEDDNGILPDTGGLSAWWLVLGAGLVVAGGGTLIARRR